MWSELLDAATAKWIQNQGGLNCRTGERLKRQVFARGGSKDLMAEFEQMVGFGSKPKLGPYLKRRGLTLGR